MKKKLGELMAEQGYITEEQIEEALRVQARPGEKRKLGEILISHGFAKPPQVQIALARQQRQS